MSNHSPSDQPAALAPEQGGEWSITFSKETAAFHQNLLSYISTCHINLQNKNAVLCIPRDGAKTE
jgi:hypothetical protein